jgi:hypothetical protein
MPGQVIDHQRQTAKLAWRAARFRTERPDQWIAASELIEVQVGAYLGEDDIVRLDDVYGQRRRNT